MFEWNRFLQCKQSPRRWRAGNFKLPALISEQENVRTLLMYITMLVHRFLAPKSAQHESKHWARASCTLGFWRQTLCVCGPFFDALFA